MNNFSNKKIGIWGFGVVGQSALSYFDQQNAAQIEILNNTKIKLPTTKTPTITTLQTEQSIQNFLESNDFIITSPGIPLHNYQHFTDKLISELDILHENNARTAIIAITGTVGKTSITHLLENIIKQTYQNTIAAGNIGYPMLNLINNPTNHAIIELSSFQLQQIKSFAPDLAIITNFFPNHLDHHQSIEEYFDAKCNILKHQTHKQLALLPLELAEQIIQKIALTPNCSFFTTSSLTKDMINFSTKHGIYHLENKIIYLTYQRTTQKIFDCSILPALTFDANWLIIIAACSLYKIDLATIVPATDNLALPDYRVQKVGSAHGSNFYNDSKSTVWQATLQAVQSVSNKPIKLFVGGLSKGADRTPLFQALQGKNIEIYTFGQEAYQLAQLCKNYGLTHQAHATLDAAWQACIENINTPHEVLFSPGGSSFDLFSDYKARGQYFTQLVHTYCSLQEK